MAFLHSIDPAARLAHRAAWDVGMAAFCLAGLGLSLAGVFTGWRRMQRKACHDRLSDKGVDRRARTPA